MFKGCGTAIITPFNEKGVNFEEFKKLIEFQIANKADSIIVCGTTGESSTMSLEERKQTIKFAVETVNKRIPVIAGTGGNCTASVIEFTKYAESIGVDAALIVTPYYNKTTQDGLVAHYSAIAKETKLPIILYSVASRTGVNITPATCKKLSKIENIVAIKEASGNISQIAEIANLCGDDLHIYSGNDDQITPILSVGGIGVISVLSNIAPEYTHNIVYNFEQGNIKEATSLQLKAIPLIKALFCEVNPIPVKAALNMLGYNVGIPRLPLVEMSDAGKNSLKSELLTFGLLK
ncbi:MAG TPA: 4-hydroxy-tetrahydrodipicolinate synthase [Candidatus Scatovivens faecipullorum]|nr:4-hydroxy-tetrahydrodipicolinate synthase [Candidatus Scatovivens faecipullorum]